MSVGQHRVCYLNGEFLPLAQAKVSVLDRGFIFGDAIYEVIPAPAGRLFALDDHLDRLERNLNEVGILNPRQRSQWGELLNRLVQHNGGGDQTVYLQVTRGVAERDHAFPNDATPTVFAMCRALNNDEGLLKVSAITLPDNRWERCDIKSTSLLANVLLRNQAVASGAYEALLIRDGYVTEGAASNVFAVLDGVVTTAPLSSKLLAGVTRKQLLAVITELNIGHQEVAISIDDLDSATEIWLTSSSRDLVCVSQLDGRAIGDGENYAVAKRVLAALQQRKQ